MKSTKLTKESVLKFLADYGSDGWSILNPDGLQKHYGFPDAWVKPLVTKQIGGEGKQALFDSTGQRVKSLVGVYSLSVLYKLAREFKVEYGSYFGRGSQARAITESLRKILEAK